MGPDEIMKTVKMAEEATEPCLQRRPLIVLVPFPAQGHVTPMLHLAVGLRRHGFQPVLVLPSSIHRRLSPTGHGRLPDVEDSGREVILAPIPDGLDDEGTQGDFFALERAMEEVMAAHFEGLLRSLECGSAGGGDGRAGRVACVVVDLLASWAMGVAARCMVPVAGFWPAMLATYRLISAAPDLVGRGLISASGLFFFSWI